MPLCNDLENDLYYFNTKPEIISNQFKSVFSGYKSKGKYGIIIHILRDSHEVYYTIVKQTITRKNCFISSYTTFNSLKKRCFNDKYKISSIGLTDNYSIKAAEVNYYD